jgi:hypothetical protein
MGHNHGYLSKRHRAVIKDMVKNGLAEYEALEKHEISAYEYRKWLKAGVFRRELDARVAATMQQSRLVMAQCMVQVICKLAEIIRTGKGETARKACLDLIALRKSELERETAEKAEGQEEPLNISDEKIGKMLDILAEDEKPEAGK